MRAGDERWWERFRADAIIGLRQRRADAGGRDTPHAMSQDNVEIVRKLFEQMGRGDLVATAMIDPDIEHARIGFDGVGLSGRWRGHDGLWAAVLDVTRVFDALRMEGERFIDLDDEGVFVLARHRAVGRISGAPVELRTAHVFKLRGGRIVRWDVYNNRDEARKAAGLAR